MLLNTRNFLLYLLCVAFLVIAIAVTATTRPSENQTDPLEDMVPIPAEISNEATVISAVSLNRQTRLSEMKEKVSAMIGSVITAPAVSELESEPSADPVISGSSSPQVFTEQRCTTYVPFTDSWQASGLSFTVVEGARLLSRSIPGGEESVLQLPLRSFPLPVKSCLQTDVVAIALDGSLIRNNEVSLYSIFSEETLLGYTIDGFPLYGVSERPTDECGGRTADGQYQYYLRADTPYILGCFAGIPVEL